MFRISVFVLLLHTIQGFSQTIKPLTLQECISKALANNLQTRQIQYQIQENESRIISSKFSQYPNVNGSFSQNFASGRIIDPFTNVIINQNTNYQNLGINSSVVVFEGGVLRNNIRLNELGAKSSQQELNATKENIKLKVIEAFFQVLNAQEQLAITKKIFESSTFQLNRIETLLKEGMASKAVLFDIQAQISGEELGVANAESALEYAKIVLLQVMNENKTTIEIDTKNMVQSTTEPYSFPVNAVMQSAIGTQSIVDVAKTKVEISEIGIDLAEASNKPSVSANLNMGTNYSSAAPDQRFVSDGKPSKFIESKSNDYVLSNGQKQNIIKQVEVPSGDFQKLGYTNQLGYNFSTIVGFNVRVPIFNAFDSKIKIQQANLSKLKAENELNITQIQVKNTVALAYRNMQTAYLKLGLINKQLAALEVAFDLTKKKFEEGNLSSLEYTLAKNNIDKVRVSVVQAKYEYIFRTKVLDFYADRI
ncbi:outer membrane protein [Arcicella aurantiaca]|uniref:Outer membrane protein n=1 Tax=Arcicella aurantiaca TaxID=591202 RepID=A0A316DII3_9BACT|nr:TolC family protein [Arcicella aurantiaca]PWK17322.1 outer membrane protein [Arcicella aurantiaca]